MLVSVIIPAYNEGERLGECLKSVCQQDMSVEIILVDNGSTDETRAVCNSYPVKYVYFDAKKSSYAARNEGVRNAAGDVLVFLDADLVFVPSFLTELLRDYHESDFRRVFVGSVVDDPRVPAYLRNMSGVRTVGSSDVARIPTAAVGVPRRLFETVGGFDDNLLSGGDFDFFTRLKAACNPTMYRPEGAVAYHYWASSLRDFLLREERFAFGKCLRARKDAQPPPGLFKHIAAALVTGFYKVPAIALVPIRMHPTRWLDCWRNQVAHVLGKIWSCKGIAKFRFGFSRAGDL
jgi:glycosyltransferase involved in cell wall biosynthesis